MVKLLRPADFKRILEAIHKVDDERILEVMADAKARIPPPEDLLKARGPSWARQILSQVASPAPTIPPVGVPGIPSVTITVVHFDGTFASGWTIRVFNPITRTDLPNPELQGTHDQSVVAAIPAGTYTFVATLGALQASRDATVAGAIGAVTLQLPAPAVAPPTPPPVTVATFILGQAVRVFGTLLGHVAAVPAVPTGLYTIRLDAGGEVMADYTQLSAVTGPPPGFIPPSERQP